MTNTKQQNEPELVNYFGSEYEKVPRFYMIDAEGNEVVHPAFHDPSEGEIDAFYVRQPVMLSFCRLRTAARLRYDEVNPRLFRDFDSNYREMTPDQVDAYTRFIEGDFSRLAD
ncbi:MAG: hypothetical protein Q4C56_01820 [Peptococcaceae bacterium]|nr:hypothetical protein [Peptococcaceae bacterium]